jgi:hypothetical protein
LYDKRVNTINGTQIRTYTVLELPVAIHWSFYNFKPAITLFTILIFTVPAFWKLAITSIVYFSVLVNSSRHVGARSQRL